MASFFRNDNKTTPPPFTPASKWTPALSSLSPQLSTLIEHDLRFIDNRFRTHNAEPNLTEPEFLALKQLSDNENIIIKPADKGSSVVIMDKTQYLWEGNRQLNDTEYYCHLKYPLFPDTIPLVREIVDKIYDKHFINFKQRTYLLGPAEPRPRIFYMLPKIHKEQDKWSLPFEIPPGRPIVSDCSSETYHTAEYIEYYLNPLSIKHASYIKDTSDFCQKISKMLVPSGALLFTLDVDSLYTNIVSQEGLKIVQKVFSENPDPHRPDAELLQLLDINLTRNDFEFNGEFYLQTKGTAMGKKFAPSYANLFMADWEVSALNKCTKKPLYYYRYLDDIWGVWTHSEDDFEHFLCTLNTHNPSITLKATKHFNSVDFLDTTTYKGPLFLTNNILDVKVFFKKTDTHALLHRSSFHPKHTFAGLIKSQLLRFHRICTQESDFYKATKVLFAALSTRGYSRSFLRRCFKTFQERHTILDTPMLPLVVTYSKDVQKLVHNIKNNFARFQEESNTLRDHRIITAFRKNANLRDCLVHAKITHRSVPTDRMSNNCFKRTRLVQNKLTHTVFETDRSGHVRSQNCVYLITCGTCGKQYVGETKQALLTTLCQLQFQVQTQTGTSSLLAEHLVVHGWAGTNSVVLQVNKNWTDAQRRAARSSWIGHLNTLSPEGLNHS